MSIQLGSGNVPPQAFQRWLDPDGNPLVSINRDGTITTTGVRFADGSEQTSANSGSVPTTVIVNITSAQLLALTVNNPILLIPGIANTYIQLLSYNMEYIYGTVAYHAPAPFSEYQIQLGNSFLSPVVDGLILPTPILAAGFITVTQNTFSSFVNCISSVTNGASNTSAVSGVGIYLTNSSANGATLGNGTLKITLTYNALPL